MCDWCERGNSNTSPGLRLGLFLLPSQESRSKVGDRTSAIGTDDSAGDYSFRTFLLSGEAGECPAEQPFVIRPTSRDSPDTEREWSFLPHEDEKLRELAEAVVAHGTDVALREYPHEKFGNLITADRREIERFRTIARLLKEFDSNKKPKRPLSLGVFGQPGTGKSFVVKALARSVYDNKVNFQTFNLSQLSKPDDLNGPRFTKFGTRSSNILTRWCSGSNT